jgi:hypothetical protein
VGELVRLHPVLGVTELHHAWFGRCSRRSPGGKAPIPPSLSSSDTFWGVLVIIGNTRHSRNARRNRPTNPKNWHW